MKKNNEAEVKLNKELSTLHAVLDGISEPVVVIDTSYEVKLINRAALEHFGVAKGEGPLICYECFHGLDRACEGDGVHCPMADVKKTGNTVTAVHEHHMPDGKVRVHELIASPFRDGEGNFLGIIETIRDVTEKKMLEDEREKLIAELQDALATIKTLRGLIPICAWCKKIRDDDGFWRTVEKYVEEHSEARFTHGICPECDKKLREEEQESS